MVELRSNKRKKKKSWKKRSFWILLIILAMVIGYVIYLFSTVFGAAQDSHHELNRPEGKSELREETVTIGEDPISILLIGVEDYETDGENGRADTQIVVTLNPDTNQMSMTTVPRDSRIEFTQEEAQQYVGTHKINAAYTYGSIYNYKNSETNGGNMLTVKKVEELLNIPIDEYVMVNFDGFRKIVDALGGVTVDIKEPFWEKNFYTNDRIVFEEGVATLDGEEALAFVRMRKREVNAIYSREERQQQFIQASIDQAISAETLFKVGEISSILGENVSTSLSPNEIYQLQRSYSSMNTSGINKYEIGGSDQRINGTYYFIPTDEGLSTVTRQLKEELGIEGTPNTESTTNESQTLPE